MPPRTFPGDEELGKRDDDHKHHKPGRPSPLTNVMMHARLPQRRNLKRLGILAAVVVGLWLFFTNIPIDVKQPSRRPNYDYSPDSSASVGTQVKPGNKGSNIPSNTGDPAREDGDKTEKHWYNGPIKFYKLAASLHAIARNGGGGWANQNVLFAASNLKSASALLPMACEMSILKRNNVHFAIMGRDEISLDTLKELNGVATGCDIMYHGTYHFTQCRSFLMLTWPKMRDLTTLSRAPITEWKLAMALL
jgi:hypothetical protein